MNFINMRSIQVILCVFVLSACQTYSKKQTTSSSAAIPIKSAIDERRYAYQLLDNQLRVLYVSDPNADKAAASLDVAVGSHDDPKDRAGLAHFWNICYSLVQRSIHDLMNISSSLVITAVVSMRIRAASTPIIFLMWMLSI